MSDVVERRNEHSEAIERLQQQKKIAIKEVVQLSEQITANLLAGEDVADLLAARGQKQALIEAINPVLIGAMRQLDDLQFSMQRRPLAELKNERSALWRRHEILKTKTLLGSVNPNDTKGQSELASAFVERERLCSAIAQLDRVIRDMQTQSLIEASGAN